jgi:hypothetical protein
VNIAVPPELLEELEPPEELELPDEVEPPDELLLDEVLLEEPLPEELLLEVLPPVPPQALKLNAAVSAIKAVAQ